MIIIKIDEGLGNQLFKYAFARSLSYDLGTELYIDKFNPYSNKEYFKKKIMTQAGKIYNILCNSSYYMNTNFHYNFSHYLEDIPHAQYFLNHFNIKEKIFKKKMKRVNFYNFPYVGDENLLEFPKIENIKTPAYISGAFQSEKYFLHNKDIIKEDLKLKHPAKGKNKEIAEDIQNNNSIAIHVRRGDYLKIPSMGICTLDYYKKAINFISKQVNNPKFYIFSNDPKWTQENIKIDHPTYYVTNNPPEKGYEDLRLMTLCDNFIIANSSFSWWGAWLSENKNKIIIRPEPWFFQKSSDFYDIKSKLCKHIPNNYSSYFNNSSKTILNLDSNNLNEIFHKQKNVKLSSEEDEIIVKSKNRPKLFLKEIEHNNQHPIILKLSCFANKKDVLRLFYLTKENKDYHHGHSFGVVYNKNEELDIYFPIPKNTLIKELMFVPSKKKNTALHIKHFEIREIDNVEVLF